MSLDNEWTIKIRDVNLGSPFEFRPIEMNLKKSRTEYDFCRAKAATEVGDEMKYHTRYENGKLRELKPVDICYAGETVQRLLFRPDWVDYGTEFTHLQFHDIHKALASGTIDKKYNSVKLKPIYREVIAEAHNTIIDEVKFTLPDNQVRRLISDRIADNVGQGRNSSGHIEQEETAETVSSNFAVNFENISPEEAIHKLNDLYNLKSWVNKEGELIIGFPEATQIRHIAAPDDDRVLRYKDPQINHGREPIKQVIVKGAWVNDPGLEVTMWDWFDKGGTNDFIAMGIAEREDIDFGSTKFVESSGAKRNAMPHVASLVLREEMKQANVGTVEIDPSLSGTKHTNPLDLSPGDFLHLVPDDGYFTQPTRTSGRIGDNIEDFDRVPGEFVHNEAYLISEVEHNLSKSGNWTIQADISMYPDVSINSYMDYMNPEEDTWVDDSEIDNDDGNLKKNSIFEEF